MEEKNELEIQQQRLQGAHKREFGEAYEENLQKAWEKALLKKNIALLIGLLAIAAAICWLC